MGSGRTKSSTKDCPVSNSTRIARLSSEKIASVHRSTSGCPIQSSIQTVTLTFLCTLSRAYRGRREKNSNELTADIVCFRAAINEYSEGISTRDASINGGCVQYIASTRHAPTQSASCYCYISSQEGKRRSDRLKQLKKLSSWITALKGVPGLSLREKYFETRIR